VDTESLEGKVALVTGAASGLGEATARAFAAAGCRVACVDINEGAVRETADSLGREVGGADAVGIRCDVSDEVAVFAAVGSVAERFGRLDFAVNSAAVDYTLPLDDLSVAQWDRVLAVNLRGPFLVSKAALPVMRRQQSGHIVNIASTAATRAWAGAAAYHASKWGLVGFTRALGVEGRADGVRATAVIPGGMRTHFFDRFEEQGIPMPDPGNLQDPANVARVILLAVSLPRETALQEVIVTPLTEPGWP
jgi:NAD(P)-dependent dehydrogenase (short-subunit alcohol dehydrogenase family)